MASVAAINLGAKWRLSLHRQSLCVHKMAVNTLFLIYLGRVETESPLSGD